MLHLTVRPTHLCLVSRVYTSFGLQKEALTPHYAYQHMNLLWEISPYLNSTLIDKEPSLILEATSIARSSRVVAWSVDCNLQKAPCNSR